MNSSDGVTDRHVPANVSVDGMGEMASVDRDEHPIDAASATIIAEVRVVMSRSVGSRS
jgi:hypothetical protein